MFLRSKSDRSFSPDLGIKWEPEERFQERIQQCEDVLEGPMKLAFRHHFSVPGKLLRARVAHASARNHGASDIDALNWALAVDLVHNASLLHDDICDNDTRRRGQPTVAKRFGTERALCLGDSLIALAFNLLTRSSMPRELTSKLSAMIQFCARGQAMEFVPGGYPTWDRYCEIATAKTSSLISGAVEGGMLFDSLAYNTVGVTKFCERFSLIFQILNDLKNVSDGVDLGMCATDFSRARPNALLVLFRDSLSKDEGERFDSSVLVTDSGSANYLTSADSWWGKFVNSSTIERGIVMLRQLVTENDWQRRKLPPVLRDTVGWIHAFTDQSVQRQIKIFSKDTSNFSLPVKE